MSQSRRRWNSGPSTPSSKKKKHYCKFLEDWTKLYDWVQPTSLGNDMAFCKLCSTNFSVSHGGVYDIKRHADGDSHKKAVASTRKSTNLKNADPERIFSMLKRIQTDMRSELNNDTLCSLLCAKQNQNLLCYEYEPSDSVLRSAKQAVLSYQSGLK